MSRWPLHKGWFWERAPFFRILVPFAAGIFCYELSSKISLSIICGILAVAAIVYVLMQLLNRNKRILSFALLNIVFLCAGYAVCHINDIRNSDTWYGNNNRPETTALVRITDMPAEKESTWKLNVEVVRMMKAGNPIPATGKGFVYLYKDVMPMMLHKGDSIWVPGNWTQIQNAGNPYEFDYAAYCRHNNIYCQQFCSGKDVRLYSTNDPAATPAIDRLHDWCTAQLDLYVTNSKARGLIQAMLLGDEYNLDADIRQSFSDTGIVHVIAISGGNVMIFFAFISALLWWMKDRKYLWVKYLIALPLVWFYVVMAGSSPSAIRAAIMFSLLAFGVLFQKNNNSLNQLFATAFLLLCAQPMWLYSAGFQLSFVAVLSIIIFYSPIYKLIARPEYWIARKVWQATAASLAAEILVAPIVIYYFHNFPVFFLVANVLAFAFMEVVLLAGIAIILLSFIPALAHIIGAITIRLVAIFGKLIGVLQYFNPSSFRSLSISAWELTLVYITISGITFFILRKGKPTLFVGLSALCLFLLSSCFGEWNNLHQQHLVVYNAGRGNHIERIDGKYYRVLHTDTAVAKKIAYATTPAHIQWQVERAAQTNKNELQLVGSKKVLLLSAPVTGNNPFPVDDIVINYTGAVDLKKIMAVFSPEHIVIGNNYSRQQIESIVKSSGGMHAPLHIIAWDGAFVVDGL